MTAKGQRDLTIACRVRAKKVCRGGECGEALGRNKSGVHIASAASEEDLPVAETKTSERVVTVGAQFHWEGGASSGLLEKWPGAALR